MDNVTSINKQGHKVINLEIVDAGWADSQALWGLIGNIKGQSWFIPTDKFTALAMQSQLGAENCSLDSKE